MRRRVQGALLYALVVGVTVALALPIVVPSARPVIELAHAQGVPVTLSGRVFDGQGQPLSNQRVMLSAGINLTFSAVTNSTGAYSLTVSTGTYTLTIDNGTM